RSACADMNLIPERVAGRKLAIKKRRERFSTSLATARRVASRKLAIQKRADADKNPPVVIP
ncbi:hypothetical protein, partial [Pectobacterium aroidearum]|uniref:hypothetical protein n=1 Tax=Pectobacterium aroidearum TaxID=1201031 RepID=UPI001C697CEC